MRFVIKILMFWGYCKKCNIRIDGDLNASPDSDFCSTCYGSKLN